MSDNLYFTLLTDRGREKLRAAIVSGEKLHLTHMAVGDGGGDPMVPAETMTRLVNEVFRGPISNNSVDPNNATWTVLNLVIPVDTGGWYVREAGIYDADGELIFIGSLPENYKALPTQGVASDLSVNLIVDIQRADSVTIVVDPATVLASQEWTGQVVESYMRLHDEDPMAHETLVERLKQGGEMVGRDEVTNEVDRALDAAIDQGLVIGRDELNEELVRALVEAAESGLVRKALTDDLTLYVRQGGDDSASGITEEEAVASLERIKEILVCMEPAGHMVTVDLGAGNFPCTEWRVPGYSAFNLRLTGKGTEQTGIVGKLEITSSVYLSDLSIERQMDVHHCLVHLANIRFRAMGQNAIQCFNGTVMISQRIEYEGTAASALMANRAGHIAIAMDTRLVMLDEPEFTVAFAHALRSGSISFLRTVFEGNAVGRQYLIQEGGILTGVYAQDLPGDRPGLTNTDEGMISMQGEISLTGTSGRKALTDDLTLYVRQDGDDSADGLSEEAPVKTLARALQLLSHYDPCDKTVTIDVGEGDYDAGLAHVSGYCRYNLIIRGAGREHTAIRPVGSMTLGAMVSELSIEGAISVHSFSEFYNIRFLGLDGNGGIQVQLSTCFLTGTIEFAGKFPYALMVNRGGHASCMSTVFRCEDVPSFSTAFFVATRHGFANFFAASFEGECLGRKYSLTDGGSYSFTYGERLDTLPGDQPGRINTSASRSSHEGLAVAGGLINSSQQLNHTFGCVESLTKVATGQYDIHFTRPLPTMRAVATHHGSKENGRINVLPSGDGSKITLYCSKDGTTPEDRSVHFIVF